MAYAILDTWVWAPSSPTPDGFGVDITPDGAHLYITNFGSNNVAVMDTTTGATATPIPVGTGPVGIKISPDGTLAFVCNMNSNTVSVISLATNTVIDTITGFSQPHDVKFSNDGTKAYVSNYSANTVSVITISGYTISATIAVGTKPYGISLNPAGTYAYVVNTFQGSSSQSTVSVIDLSSNSVVATITIPYQSGYSASQVPQTIAISSDGTTGYVGFTNSNPAAYNKLNLTTNAWTSLTTGSSTYGFPYVTTSGNYAYFTGNSNVTVVNMTTGAIVATPTINGNENLVADPTGAYLYSVVSDGHVYKVSLLGSPTISTATITGTPSVGNTLTANYTGVTGTPSPVISYQWNANGTAISGATSSTLYLDGTLAYKTITVTIYATNYLGQASQTSTATTQISRIAGDPTKTTIAAAPNSGLANGIDTSLITVDVLSSASASVGAGGDVVTLATTTGSLSSITDNGNGTYNAVLTAPTTTGTATITGVLNGTAISSTATVTFGVDRATSLSITSEPDASVASGSPFVTQPVIHMLDATGNLTTTGAGVVTAWVVSGDGNGELTNATATIVNGIATFSGLTLYGTSGVAYQILFTCPAVTSATSSNVTLTSTSTAPVTPPPTGTALSTTTGTATVTSNGFTPPSPLTVALQHVDHITGVITVICELSTATDITVTETISGPGDISFTVTSQEMARIANVLPTETWEMLAIDYPSPDSLLDPYGLEVVVSLGGTILKSGPVLDASADGDTQTIKVRAGGLLSWLDTRATENYGSVVDPLYGSGPTYPLLPPSLQAGADNPDGNALSYTKCWLGAPPTSYPGWTNIYADLLSREAAKPAGKLGFGTFTYGTGARVPGAQQLDFIKFSFSTTLTSALQQLQQQGVGYEFWIESSSRNPTLALYRGNDNRTTVVLSNRNSYGWKQEKKGTDLTTIAIATGTGKMAPGSKQTVNGMYPPPNVVTRRMKQYGRHVYSPTGTGMTTTTQLNALCSAYEVSTNRPDRTLSLTYDAGPGRPYAVTDIGCGDLISVELATLYEGLSEHLRQNTITPFRVTSWIFTSPEAGTGHYTLELELEQVQLDPTTGNPIIRGARSLYAPDMVGLLYNSVFK